MSQDGASADEDAFLWADTVPADAKQTPVGRLSEAEKLAVRLCFDVMLQSAFALEDPNERFWKSYGHLSKTEQPARGPTGREVSSDELANHLYELKTHGGVVGLEVNPPDAPALARVVLIAERVTVAMDKILLAFERAALFTVHELPPLKMTHPTEAETGGNRFFRLVTDAGRKISHDVTCLLAWIDLEDGAKMLEITAWPVEKATHGR